MKKTKFLAVALSAGLLFSQFNSNLIVEASSQPNVTVKLKNFLGDVSNVNISFSGEYTNSGNIKLLPNVNYKLVSENGVLKLYNNTTLLGVVGSSFTLNPTNIDTEHIIMINNRKYMGDMTFTIENNNVIRPINSLPMDEYLKGVVPYEMSDNWGNNGGLEALKSQAIAARTFATRVNNGVITDTQSHQVYGGYMWYPNAIRAVIETKGKVLEYDNKLVEAYYSSSNGGKVLSNKNSWGSTLIPYLQTKDDPYDLRSGNSNLEWLYSLSKVQFNLNDKDLTKPELWWNNVTELATDATELNNMKLWLQQNGLIGTNYEIKISEIPLITFTTTFDSNQRIDGVVQLKYVLKNKDTNQFVMQDGKIKIHDLTVNRRAYDIRAMIGSSIMKSPYIKSVADNGTSFTVTGGGWGHGIGMSQYGAYQMSKEGLDFKNILNFYYPSSNIDDYYSPIIDKASIDIDEKNKLTIAYQLDETSSVNAFIKNETTNESITIISNARQDLGENIITFDASKLGGNYKVSIEAVDEYGNKGIYDFEEGLYIGQSYETEAVDLTINLTERAKLYSDPYDYAETDLSLSPQRLKAVEKTLDGQYYQVLTWVGPMWIKPVNPIVGELQPINLSIPIEQRVPLYSLPFDTHMTNATIAPQEIYAIESWNGFIKVKTWLGNMYIKYNVPQPVTYVNDMILTERTNLYGNHSPTSASFGTLAPQQIKTSRKIGSWIEVETYLGKKWVKPNNVIVGTKSIMNKYITTTERKNLYKYPDLKYRTGATLSPQQVYAIEEFGNFILIKTWMGNLYIEK